jgi:hypothetical protein
MKILACLIFLFSLESYATTSNEIPKGEAQPWAIGLSFEEDTYSRLGWDLYSPSLGLNGGQIVLSVGSQNYLDNTSVQRMRKAVDGKVGWIGYVPLAGPLYWRSGVDAGIQTYAAPNGGAGMRTFGFVDLVNGFSVRQGRFDIYTSVGVRANFIGMDKDTYFGSRKVEPERVYPQFGLAYRFE